MCATLRSIALAALMPLGCSSSSTPGQATPVAPSDASTQPDLARAESDAGTDAPMEQTCGEPPFVTLGIVVQAAAADNMGTPVEGARLTTPLCPDKTQVSGPGGHITGRVSKGVPFYVRFEATNYIPTLVSEQQFDVDTSPILAPLPPSLFSALIPEFGPDKTAIFIGVMPNGGTGACNSLDGVRFEVIDHPEAKTTYYSNDAIPAATGGTSTTESGRAVITKLAPGPMVTVRGTKDGCTVKLASGSYTGRSPLEAGFVTLTPAYLGN